MDFNAIIKRVIAIVTKPKDEWGVIKNESTTIADLYLKYAIIVAAIPAVAGLIGKIVFGGGFRGMGLWLSWAVSQYILILGASYLLAVVIDLLAPYFGVQKNMTQSLKIAIFSYTGIWLAGALMIIPTLMLLVLIIGIVFSLVLLYFGLIKLKEVAQDKLIGFLVAIMVSHTIIFLIADYLAKRVAFGRLANYMY
jgi:hypothetical protein